LTADSNLPGATYTVLDTINVSQTVYQEFVVYFPQTTDDYFAFRLVHNGTTTASGLYIDDVYYEDAPICKPINVKDIQLSNILKNAIDISWADHFNTNAIYHVEVRETGDPGDPGAAFIGVTAPGVTTIQATGLNPSTKYMVYIKAVCSSSDEADWSEGADVYTMCDYPNLISALPVTVCGFGPVDLTASFDAGVVHWYDAPEDGNLLHTGNTFTTPPLSADTSYWVSAGDSI